MKKYSICAITVIYLAHCTSSKNLVKNAAPSEKELIVAQKSDSKISIINLNKGYAIYTNQCTECHKAFTIVKFSEKKWKHEIEDMSPKAKLSEEEKANLSAYVLSFREVNAVVSK